MFCSEQIFIKNLTQFELLLKPFNYDASLDFIESFLRESDFDKKHIVYW